MTSMREHSLISGFIVSILLVSCGLNLPEPHALKYDDKKFNDVANFILNQNEVHEMDDFTRHHKFINGVSIKLRDGEGNQDGQFLNVAIDSLNLDQNVVMELRTKLEETSLRDFTMSGDSILFIVDGFLDNSWGFFYTRRGAEMDSTWFTFDGHSVKFVEDINDKWKRAAIR